MSRKILSLCALATLAPALVACGSPTQPTAAAQPSSAAAQSSSAAQSTGTGVLVIGAVGDETDEIMETHQPLADYLAANLQSTGVTSAKVEMVPDLDALVESIEAGEVDLFFDSPYPAMIASDKAGAEPILRRWKDGVEEYHSIIYTSADSGLTSLEGLNGKLIGLEDEGSTSGYFAPVTYLLQEGMNPVEKESMDDTVAGDEVGYVFTGDEEEAVEQVLSGELAASVLTDGTYAELPEDVRAKLTVLAETEPVARHIALVKPNMDSAMRDAITDVLVGMDETPEGQTVLQQFEETAQFDEFPTEDALARMREMYQILQVD